MIGDPHFSGHRSKSEEIADWINPAAFEPAFGNDPNFWANYTQTDPRAWTFGNMKPRTDAIRGPGFWNLDSSLMKDFHLVEERYFEFRWEVFNVLNLTRFDVQSLNLSITNASTFGDYSALLTNPRTMQFALRYEF